jgi:hypothetical protein
VHGNIMHAHIIHGLVMDAYAVRAHTVHRMLYVRINSDMPTAAIGPKPVYQHAN